MEILEWHKQQLKTLHFEAEKEVENWNLINDTEHTGWSSMHLAVYYGFEKFYIWLLNEGGDVTKESKDGWDCLSLAVWQR